MVAHQLRHRAGLFRKANSCNFTPTPTRVVSEFLSRHALLKLSQVARAADHRLHVRFSL